MIKQEELTPTITFNVCIGQHCTKVVASKIAFNLKRYHFFRLLTLVSPMFMMARTSLVPIVVVHCMHPQKLSEEVPMLDRKWIAGKHTLRYIRAAEGFVGKNIVIL